MTSLTRSALALLLFSGWLALLFAGLAGGGAVHLLLVGAVAVFPWKALRRGHGHTDEHGRARTTTDGDQDSGLPSP